MSLIDDVKELADLVDQSKHIDLFRKILNVQGETLKLLEENNNLKQENQQLRHIIEIKENLVFEEPVYYLANDETPFCPRCWESETKLIHLIRDKGSARGRCICTVCKTVIDLTPENAKSPSSKRQIRVNNSWIRR